MECLHFLPFPPFASLFTIFYNIMAFLAFFSRIFNPKICFSVFPSLQACQSERCSLYLDVLYAMMSFRVYFTFLQRVPRGCQKWLHWQFVRTCLIKFTLLSVEVNWNASQGMTYLHLLLNFGWIIEFMGIFVFMLIKNEFMWFFI